MENDSIEGKIKGFLAEMEAKEWDSMKNDIERYQKIKELVINAFKAVLVLSPQQVSLVIQHKITKFEDLDPIFEFEELKDFLKFAHITSTGILSSLDEKEVDDYAAPHQAMGYLDELLGISENGEYSEDNVSLLGAAISVELSTLRIRLTNIDWKKGWSEPMN